MADEFSVLRSAFIIGGEPGSPGQGYIDPSVGNVTGLCREANPGWVLVEEGKG